jgi:hypothetical protein
LSQDDQAKNDEKYKSAFFHFFSDF